MEPQKKWWEDERKALAAILAVALIVRIAAALTTFVISKDGARFTLMARLFGEGAWDRGLDTWPRMSPLYPMMILGFGSGSAIAVVLGTLSLLPLYFLARSIWDRRVATLTIVLAALLPENLHHGSIVMSEAPFMFFFFSAMLFVHRAAERAVLVDYALAGVSGGLACLTRPEGVYVIAAVIGWTVLRAAKLGGWPRRLGGIALAVVLFAIVVSPYANWIHEKTGRWDIADSPVIAAVKNKIGLSSQPVFIPGEAVETIEKSKRPVIVEYLLTWLKISGYALAPFLLVGFARLRRTWGDAYVVVLGAGYAIPPLINLLVGTWFSARFLLPAMVLWLPIVALGMLSVKVPARLGLAFVALLGVAFAIKEIRPDDLDRRTLIDAGSWIRANSAPRPLLVSMDRRIDHYAEGYSVIAELRFDPLREQAKGAQWIVLLSSRMDRAEPGYLERVAAAYDLACVIPKSARGEEIRIYRVR